MARTKLGDFIFSNREAIIARTRAKIAQRLAPRPTQNELTHGVPLFLDQLVLALRVVKPSAETIGAIGEIARMHGRALQEHGFTVAQVVRDYGDVCQAVTELADEADTTISTEEFHTFNRCLDDAIAEAVTEFTRLRDSSFASGESQRSGELAHELGNHASAATLAFSLLERGNVAINRSVGAVLKRNLKRLGTLIDRSLLEARIAAGNEHRQRVAVFDLIEEAEIDGALEADSRHLSLSVSPVDHGVDVDVDPHLVSGAIANLLLNAMKFTHKGGHVWLKTSASATRVLIEVEDECGGLPVAKAEVLFDAFSQHGADRSGLGLGLFISRKSIDASGGVLRVRDVPGVGCVFTIDLPRLGAA
jgi:signal transduction histidine kinase